MNFSSFDRTPFIPTSSKKFPPIACIQRNVTINPYSFFVAGLPNADLWLLHPFGIYQGFWNFTNHIFSYFIKKGVLGGVILHRDPRRKRSPGFCIFPGYRWCGPGCSGPGAPVNDVDACCMKHDLCLRRGKPACQCDYEFMDCLRSKMNPHTQKGRHAILMYRFMQLKTLGCGRNDRFRK